MAKMLKLTQKKSVVGQSKTHRATIKALGLGKIGRVVTCEDSKMVQGMLRKVAHLVQVEEVDPK